jgi:peptidoglycan/LPS O-acetylase OafA/YrhL
LCVEEQFYLYIAPFLAIFAQRKKQYLSLLLLIIFFCPTLFRYFELYDYINETHVRFDGCILGVLLAQARYQYHFIWLKMAESSIAVGTLGLIIFVSMVLTKYYPDIIYVPRDKLLLACIFGSWVLLANKNDYWRTLLYFPGCNYIATRSYALYLLHPEILALAKRYLIDVHFVYYFAFVLVGSIAIAEVLYLLIEKPIMDAREKFSFSKTKDLPKQATRI